MKQEQWTYFSSFFIIFCLVGLLLPDLFSPCSRGEFSIFSVALAVSIQNSYINSSSYSFKRFYHENSYIDAIIGLGLPHYSVNVVPIAVQLRLLAWQHFIVTAVLCSSTSTVP